MSIEIYTLSYCPYCAAAKRFFDERGLKYTAYQLAGNEYEPVPHTHLTLPTILRV